MADLETVRAAVDAQLTADLPTIEGRQEAYLLLHNKYWQGLRTHSATPADGIGLAADRLGDTPTDIAEPWPSEIMPAVMLGTCQIDALQWPDGSKEFTITCEVEINGELNRRRWSSLNGYYDWQVIS